MRATGAFAGTSRSRASVVTYSLGARSARTGHEASTRDEIAKRLAALTGSAYEGEYDPVRRYAGTPYFVPHDTLTSQTASRIGVRNHSDLFGAVVPYRFVATKTITHPLVDARSRSPRGWNDEFPRRVCDIVLDGFSAFAINDALRAGCRLLDGGAVRIKPATGVAGLGQHPVTTATDLVRALDTIDAEEMARSGVVVEQNLLGVTTYSVGQVRVADLIGTYCGIQHLTTNHRGEEVYGGSDITMARGDFDALLALRLSDDLRLAIAQAQAYDRAAEECFDGFFASRRNYDVAQGRDGIGCRRSGVLEQSWRLGGASSAEIVALEAFKADPTLAAIHAMAREVYGETADLPPAAAVFFRGLDPNVGLLIKYAWTRPYADT